MQAERCRAAESLEDTATEGPSRQVYMELEQGKNADFWRDMTIITEDEISKLRKLEASGKGPGNCGATTAPPGTWGWGQARSRSTSTPAGPGALQSPRPCSHWGQRRQQALVEHLPGPAVLPPPGVQAVRAR